MLKDITATLVEKYCHKVNPKITAEVLQCQNNDYVEQHQLAIHRDVLYQDQRHRRRRRGDRGIDPPVLNLGGIIPRIFQAKLRETSSSAMAERPREA